MACFSPSKILVTGAAGFIGAEACLELVARGHVVVGVDEINDYYNTSLKFARLSRLGIAKEQAQGHELCPGIPGFSFLRLDIAQNISLLNLFERENFAFVLHLAAQAGVRYSLQNPWAYLHANLTGTLSVLEACRRFPVQHLVYASSSSVYGEGGSPPFSVQDKVDHPVSFYAATKKSNELMAHTYSHLYKIPTTGLRFFTVYGPWGRPDMAPMLFAKAILENMPICLFNHGNMRRDFTYISDIVEGTLRCLFCPPGPDYPNLPVQGVYHVIHNIGRGNPLHLQDFVALMEQTLGKKALLQLSPMQPGDVPITWADTTSLQNAVGYTPQVSPEVGVASFARWYLEHLTQGIF